MTVVSASVLFHRFFREVNTTDYDIYVSHLIINTRDLIVNVAHRVWEVLD